MLLTTLLIGGAIGLVAGTVIRNCNSIYEHSKECIDKAEELADEMIEEVDKVTDSEEVKNAENGSKPVIKASIRSAFLIIKYTNRIVWFIICGVLEAVLWIVVSLLKLIISPISNFAWR